MIRIFFSYSHRDEGIRNELEIHMSMLKRQGVIEAWHDRRILGGSHVDSTIDANLMTSDLILLLVSPYFLASNYCYEIEMQTALSETAGGRMRVLPVIVEVCDWKNSPLAPFLAVPSEGKPISKFPNVHEPLNEVVQEIRRIAQEIAPRSNPNAIASVVQESAASHVPIEVVRSSNLRVTRKFAEIDVDSFLEAAFEYIAKFFENSLEELRSRNHGIDTRFKRISTEQFAAYVYRDGKLANQCLISLNGVFGKGISYGNDPGHSNSYNERLIVQNDGLTLSLKASLGMFRPKQEALSQQGGAEELWSILVAPLQTKPT